MRVVTFNSESDGAVARIQVPMTGAKGKTALDWLPVAIHAPTEAEAREKAEAFYQAELDRLSTKDRNMEAGREKAAATRAAKKG